MPIAHRGLILILSSPSGAGKSTLAKELMADEAVDLTLSVSVTTRKRRGNEIDGTHYHFISEREFLMRRDAGQLLEWAQVHDNYYGTPREPVEEALAQGKNVLFDIDWQGAEQVKTAMPDDTVCVFILPPSFGELRARLHRRAEDSEDVINRRLRNALIEMRHAPNFDYAIENDDIQVAYNTLKGIVLAEQAKVSRATGLDGALGLIEADANTMLAPETDTA